MTTSNILRDKYNGIALLSDTAVVSAPFIDVDINGFKMGTFQQSGKDKRYPGYVESLKVKKINGTVNQYTLSLKYPVRAGDDPNLIEKVLGSVSDTRLMTLSYGDFSVPNNYIYKEESVLITAVKTNFDIKTAVIGYEISGVSSVALTIGGSFSFPATSEKPSDVIKRIILSKKYKLTDVFTGMKTLSKEDLSKLIASDDKVVDIPAFTNISALDYIAKLVSYMNPISNNANSIIKNAVYSLVTYEDKTTVYGGPYFSVQKINATVDNSLNALVTYEIDIGYPTSNLVTSFSVDNTDNWAILYNYSNKIRQSDYVQHIGSDGKLETKYSPLIRGVNTYLEETDKDWWTRVTEFPIKASITIKGLLKPAILMQYVKLNVWYWGQKHASSGYYIITSQNDSIDGSGFSTALTLVRVGGDNSEYLPKKHKV